MKIIADTNTFLAVAFEEPEKSEIIRLTMDHDLIAPIILPFEIANALSAMLKKHKTNTEEVFIAWDIIQTIPVELHNINVRNALNIATQFNIYAYDAYFLECAIALQFPLLTLDRRMCTIARKIKIQLMEIIK